MGYTIEIVQLDAFGRVGKVLEKARVSASASAADAIARARGYFWLKRDLVGLDIVRVIDEDGVELFRWDGQGGDPPPPAPVSASDPKRRRAYDRAIAMVAEWVAHLKAEDRERFWLEHRAQVEARMKRFPSQ